MKWKSILTAGGGNTFSVRRPAGNEFAAAITPAAIA